MRTRKMLLLGMAATLAFAVLPGAATAHPGAQHGDDEDHLIGTGATGDIDFLSKEIVAPPGTDDLIADVAADPRKNYAYLANWGEEKCAENSEAGGMNNPDAGAWVIDISNLNDPVVKTFIPHSQDSRPGEGMHAVRLTTKWFNGYVLAMNNEQCGKNGKGGLTLWDVTNPLKPKKLSEHFGDPGPADVNDIHSTFVWDAGAKAYAVMTDNEESADVDIMDITNPKRPRLIAEYDLDAMSVAASDPIFQPELGLDQSFLHDMVVKRVDTDTNGTPDTWVLVLSYWDGGYVQMNVNNPAAATIIRDTDYNNPDPELLESAGIALPPEGNGHQSEFTVDDRFLIATDEDFSPYRTIFSVEGLGERPAGEFGWTTPIVNEPDQAMNGPTIYGGYGCPGSPALPPASSLTAAPGEDKIVVLQRGPVGDPAHNYEACFFSEKAEAAQNAGYDGVIVANHHTGASNGLTPDALLCGSQGHTFTPTIPGVCIGHKTMHDIFNTPVDYSYPDEGGPAIGTVGRKVNAEATFDGWGYVHLFDPSVGGQASELDTYAVDEAHEEAHAQGSGALSVHEVATHESEWDQAYLSYYSAGIRSLEIQCANPNVKTTCELVETGSYLDEHGNDFWGVETFVKNGRTIILGSDMDSGLWIFEDTDDGIANT